MSCILVPYTKETTSLQRRWPNSVLSEVSHFNIRVQHRILEGGNEIVNELSRRDFYQEMVTVILDMCMRGTKCTHTQSQKLHIRILMV